MKLLLVKHLTVWVTGRRRRISASAIRIVPAICMSARPQIRTMSLVQAARDAGVGTTTIYRWSARYEAKGAAGVLPYQQNRAYPPERKLKAVQEYL